MRLAPPKTPEEASFDLTPMIDVVLLLIIFFMLSSQFSQLQLMPLELPRESGGDTVKSPQTLVIDVDQDGAVSVLGAPMSLEELTEMVRPHGGDDGDTRTSIIVRAHRECQSRHLNKLSEALVRGGVRAWRLATNPEGAGT